MRLAFIQGYDNGGLLLLFINSRNSDRKLVKKGKYKITWVCGYMYIYFLNKTKIMLPLCYFFVLFCFLFVLA